MSSEISFPECSDTGRAMARALPAEVPGVSFTDLAPQAPLGGIHEHWVRRL